MKDEQGKTYSKGYFVGICMAVGSAVGVGLCFPLGIATDNPVFFALGPAIGLSCGLTICPAIERRYESARRIRTLTEKEQRNLWIAVIAGIVFFSIEVLALLLIP